MLIRTPYQQGLPATPTTRPGPETKFAFSALFKTARPIPCRLQFPTAQPGWSMLIIECWDELENSSVTPLASAFYFGLPTGPHKSL